MLQPSSLDADERLRLITRNLEEVLGADSLKEMLIQGKTPRIYWGTATTAQPSIAYLLPMMKVADFLRAGCEVTILFADLHACLDAMKTPWELLDSRVRFYEFAIRSLLKAVEVPQEKLRFVRGTSFQLSREYTLDVFKLATLTTEHDAKKAGTQAVKQESNPCVGSLLYPLLQALDEQYLDCNVQYGGVDQRKIFTYAEKYLPQLGYSKRIHLMNPMVPGLNGGQMSSSDPKSKIALLDTANDIRQKVKKAFCEPGNATNNGILGFTRYVICPFLFDRGEDFIVSRPERFGGEMRFNSFEALEEAFADNRLHPADLKAAFAGYAERLLAPVRQEFENNEDFRECHKQAYGCEQNLNEK